MSIISHFQHPRPHQLSIGRHLNVSGLLDDANIPDPQLQGDYVQC